MTTRRKWLVALGAGALTGTGFLAPGRTATRVSKASPPSGSIPAEYAVPAGRWKNYTTNTLVQAGANTPSHTALMNTWNGGALVNTGPYGSIVRFGGGQHGTGNFYHGGVLVEDIDERKMKYMCRPLSGHAQTEPTDQYGRWARDLYPTETHTYNGVKPVMRGWRPDQPRGGIVMVEKVGCTMMFDISKEFEGHSKLTPDDVFYHRGRTSGTPPSPVPSRHTDATNCGVDFRRKGYWSVPRHPMGGNGRYSLYFTSAETGQMTEYSNTSLSGYWANMVAMPDEDILVWLGSFAPDGPSDIRPQIIVFDPPDLPSPRIHRISYSANANPQQQSALYPRTPAGATFRVGYMGMVWCSHPKVRKFVGIDNLAVITDVNGKAVPAGSAIKVWTLTPPPVGQRFSPTAMWVWEEHIVQSGDGSRINVRTDPGTVNGVWGACQYVPMVNAGTEQEDGQFFFTNAMNQPAKTFRLSGMA